MSLSPLVGHIHMREQLSRAISTGGLPQVLLLTGPAGVGKQRLGLWIAQRLICQTAPGAEPCGKCSGCIRVLGLAHPDVHWVMPIPRPKAGEPDKQVEETAEVIEATLAERRAAPLWGRPEPMASHGIASARLVQRKASMMSVEGGARVFLIGHAEKLVPQESSQEGANALLKLLEEPPPHSYFILTTTTPGQVLPTIRSRAIPIRAHRLTDDEVRGFLVDHRPELATNTVVAKARGSIGTALSGSGEDTKAAGAAESWLRSVGEGVSTASERALRQGPWQARGDFTHLLDALTTNLADATRKSLDQGSLTRAAASTAAIDKVMIARERAQGNVNPQLLLAVLADELTTLGVA